jgi:pimeloyl-ACP methyl ester carboxylesterase
VGERALLRLRGSHPRDPAARGGFDSTLESWRTVGVHRRVGLLDHLATSYTCITFDRRESGQSGGRVERVGWADYVAQGRGLLDHLGIERAHLMGGCVGCSTALAFGVAHPERVRSLVFFSPAGGVKYRMKQQARFGSTWRMPRSTAWTRCSRWCRAPRRASRPIPGSGRGPA